jgi:pyrroloquinoline quinone (PQQ) biosynthesis protein C
LGYSFWAENSYEHINPLIGKIRDTLQLKNSQMTFFVAHSDIDKEHAEEVERMLTRHCQTKSDWDAVERVAVLSLQLTGNMLEDVYWEYQKLVAGKPSSYSFLNQI